MSSAFVVQPMRPPTAFPNLSRVFCPADLLLDFLPTEVLLDGGGYVCLLPLRGAGLDELFVVYAAPQNAFDCPRFSLRIERVGDSALVSLIAEVPVASTLSGAEAVLCVHLDAGKPESARMLTELAEQSDVGLLTLDARTGELLSQRELRLEADERDAVLSVLDANPQEMSAARERSAQELVESRLAKPVPRCRPKTGRNDPCPCGAVKDGRAVKAKRCCYA